MKNIAIDLVKSWAEKDDCLESTSSILGWINELNQTYHVQIQKNKLSDSLFWFYDQQEGTIRNQKRSFFEITGIQKSIKGKVVLEQPVIIQDEISFLGIICKEINGVLHFLMQAKIEPGNVNIVQLSPTIQATKSNFTQAHGGAKPSYLDYFLYAKPEQLIVDQLQSEQSSRFYKKRNRNIILFLEEEVEVLPRFKWMTLGQIKELMKVDNIVNMDARTVLSCIPFATYLLEQKEQEEIVAYFADRTLYRSIFEPKDKNMLLKIYHYINQYKMFDESKTELVPLHALKSWMIHDHEIVCKQPYPFKIVFCDIAIEGREVSQWMQPLAEAVGMAVFGLLMCDDNGVKKFLVHALSEFGCFDKMELAPSVQVEATFDQSTEGDSVSALFFQKFKAQESICYHTILSEEGGRFYHEQNHNVIIQIEREELKDLPEGYFWVDYRTLNLLTQVNNCLNIQLRNLLVMLDITKLGC